MEKNKKIKVGTQYRTATVGDIDLEKRTVELSFSSEEPYERWYGIEILDHSPEAIRLSRLNDGGALLMDHNTRDQIGVIEKAEIGQDRKGRALVRFGKSARAEEVFQDVTDGIRRNVSVSYDVHKMVLEKTEDKKDWYRITDWEPLEVSLVSVPADQTVGVGREATTNELEIEPLIRGDVKKMNRCKTCNTELVDGLCPECARKAEEARIRAEAVQEVQKRTNEIMAMAQKHGLYEEAAKHIAEGKSVAEFKDLVIAHLAVDPIRTDGRAGATIADAPVYRGDKNFALGCQLRDIRLACGNDGGRERAQAVSRLEQTQKRNDYLLEKSENRAAGTGGFTTSVATDGGFFLQGETAVDLMTKGFNNSEVLSRCEQRTLDPGTQFVEVIGIDEQSRTNGNRGGGVRVYTTAELEEVTASKTKFSKIRVEPKKLTGHYVTSNEVLNNVTFLGAEMSQLFAEEFAFKGQDLVVRGTGAGEPMGLLNTPCRVAQAKETGQTADTIMTENIIKMESKIWNEGPRLVYLVNRECKPQLSTLSLSVGTGGIPVALYQQQYYEGVRQATLNGLPCITIEQCSALGDEGDIILVDLSQYITANKGGINEAMSIHTYFLYDQSAFRFVYFFDGQPRWATSVSPYKGAAGSKVSPIVTLAAR